MFKKLFIAIALMLGFLNLAIPVEAASAKDSVAAVFIDGAKVDFEVPPRYIQNRAMVPFRALAEGIGVDVVWDKATRTVTAEGKNGEVQLTIGSKTAIVGGQPRIMDVAATTIAGRTLIPLRFFGESLGARVDWDQNSGQIHIASPAKEMEVWGYYALGDQSTSSWTELFGAKYPASAVGTTDLFSGVILGWYVMDANGNLIDNSKQGFSKPDGYENVIRAARDRGVAADMMVHMSDGQLAVTMLLADKNSVDIACENIIKEAELYAGVNIDFEGLGMSQQGAALEEVRGEFTYFISHLAKGLKENGKRLTLSLHPLNSPFKGYDYRALSQLVDGIIIMAYDYGKTGTPEPLNQVKTAVDMAVSVAGADKLILGISSANENYETLPAKLNLAKSRGLKGVAFWRLGLIGQKQIKEIGEHLDKEYIQ